MSCATLLKTLGPWLLAAGHRRADQMGRRFQPQEPLISGEEFLLLIAFVFVVTIVVWNFNNWLHKRREQPFDNPRKLFRELCRAHGLTSFDRQLLQQIANWHQLTNPSQLFIERELFDTPTLAPAVGSPQEIESLRDLLFDETPEAEATQEIADADMSFAARCRRILERLSPKA